MGRALYIKKIKEENGRYYYGVYDNQPYNLAFVIAINAQRKIISYFLTSECKEPIIIIDFNRNDPLIPVHPLDKGLTGAFRMAAVQAFKAIRDNHFPDDIGRYS